MKRKCPIVFYQERMDNFKCKVKPLRWDIYSAFFDYDVGVVVLDRDVEYSNYIQPICLPITDLREGNHPLVMSGEGKRKAANQ
jgi:hypothetical protein